MSLYNCFPDVSHRFVAWRSWDGVCRRSKEIKKVHSIRKHQAPKESLFWCDIAKCAPQAITVRFPVQFQHHPLLNYFAGRVGIILICPWMWSSDLHVDVDGDGEGDGDGDYLG